MSSSKVAVCVRKVSEPPYFIETVQEQVHSCFAQWALCKSAPDSPLREIIAPGDTVLLKPNWVIHKNYSGQGNDCLVTHPNVIKAVLLEVLKAKPAKVVIADAPVQECNFDVLVPQSWREEMTALAECPVDFIDFRRTILRNRSFSDGQDKDLRSGERYTLFDLAEDSLLEPVSSFNSKFRITCYDPDLLIQHHCPGKHQYLLAKEPFEADVIINLPKMKCHKKAGITGALKNIVGLNGNKEFLPHHRLGGTGDGGDCYPGRSLLKSMAERCYDEANRVIGTAQCERWLKRSSRLVRLQSLIGNPEIEGGWHGNDTVWRMTLDLNRLLLYGRVDGTMSETPIRKIYSLTDGIVAGEGEGPLAPRPVHLGVLTFAASSVFADLVSASLMGFDWRKIPTIREAFGEFRYPLVSHNPSECRVICNGEAMSLEDTAARFGKYFQPSAGWQGHIELKGCSK